MFNYEELLLIYDALDKFKGHIITYNGNTANVHDLKAKVKSIGNTMTIQEVDNV